MQNLYRLLSSLPYWHWCARASLYARRSLIRCSNDVVTRNFLGALSMSVITSASAIAQDFPFAYLTTRLIRGWRLVAVVHWWRCRSCGGAMIFQRVFFVFVVFSDQLRPISSWYTVTLKTKKNHRQLGLSFLLLERLSSYCYYGLYYITLINRQYLYSLYDLLVFRGGGLALYRTGQHLLFSLRPSIFNYHFFSLSHNYGSG